MSRPGVDGFTKEFNINMYTSEEVHSYYSLYMSILYMPLMLFFSSLLHVRHFFFHPWGAAHVSNEEFQTNVETPAPGKIQENMYRM